MVIGAALRLPSTAVTIAGALLCFEVRFMAAGIFRSPARGGAEMSVLVLVRSVCALKAGSSAIEVSALPRSGLRQSTAPSEPAVSVARSAPPRSGWPLVCIMGTFRLETGSACGAPGARLLSDRVVRIAHV